MVTATSVDTRPYLQNARPLWNAIALAYTALGYGSGVALILLPNGWLNVLGVLLLTHSLVYSAYFSHEFMHGTIFSSRRGNEIGGTFTLWLNGGCYARFDDLALRHIAHHVDRVDFSAFDLAEAIQKLPKPLRWAVLGLEWLYFPVISFWLQWRSVLQIWLNPKRKTDQSSVKRHSRTRLLLILLIRGSLFTLLAIASLKALLLYFVAYIGMVNVLRWMDAFQHTYEVFPVGAPLPERSRQHEQENTFSTLLSVRHRWVNLLLLNFGYHNAHHELMKCPWYRLPQLDQELFESHEVHYVPLAQLLRSYHRFRIQRIFTGQGIAVDGNRNPTPETFYGAVGVSFLTLY